MPGFLLYAGATVMCPHGASATIAPAEARVTLSGQPVAVVTSPTAVAGCPFQIPFGVGTKPQPCVKVQWAAPATRVKVMGKPVLVKSSSGVCQSVEQVPAGPPSVAASQMRVKGV